MTLNLPTGPVDGLFDGFFDDAAIFPPGNLPLDQAVPAHVAHLQAAHHRMVGPFVVAAAKLGDLAALVDAYEPGSFEVAVTVPAPAAVAAAMDTAEQAAALRVVALEVAVPADVPVADVVPQLDDALAGRPEVAVYVELPRDGRRPDLIGALSGTPYRGKLRTGGVEAHLYPDEQELAEALVATARSGLPVKATAGLHHAVRNTDPATGFEQHGFLNVIAAVDAALVGADTAQVAAVLAERDGALLAARVRDLAVRAARVRDQFRSLGTCSIDEPLEDLHDLGLVPPPSSAPEGAAR